MTGSSVPATLSLYGAPAFRCAPPRDARVTCGVCEPQQQISVTWPRRTETEEIATSKFIERTQEIVLICEPALVFCDDLRTVPVAADDKTVAPLAAATDVDGTRRHTCVMLIENSAHRPLLRFEDRRGAPGRSGVRRGSRKRPAEPASGGADFAARSKKMRALARSLRAAKLGATAMSSYAARSATVRWEV
jgi:hypothetical protein